MKRTRLNTLIKISLLGVIAFILMLLEISIPIFPEFLKIDVSDLPALIGAFALGPWVGVAVELLKNILKLIIRGTNTAFVGELANFVLGAIFVMTSGMIYNRKKNKKMAAISLTVGTIVFTAAACLINIYVMLPLYVTAFHIPMDAIVAMGSKVNPLVKDMPTLVLWSIAPFNLVKGILVSAITILIYKKVSPILHNEGNYSKSSTKIERV